MQHFQFRPLLAFDRDRLHVFVVIVLEAAMLVAVIVLVPVMVMAVIMMIVVMMVMIMMVVVVTVARQELGLDLEDAVEIEGIAAEHLG